MFRTPPTEPAEREGSVHAAGVEFDDAFFVGQAAEADAVVFGIVLAAEADVVDSVQGVRPSRSIW